MGGIYVPTPLVGATPNETIGDPAELNLGILLNLAAVWQQNYLARELCQEKLAIWQINCRLSLTSLSKLGLTRCLGGENDFQLVSQGGATEPKEFCGCRLIPVDTGRQARCPQNRFPPCGADPSVVIGRWLCVPGMGWSNPVSSDFLGQPPTLSEPGVHF